MKNQKITSVYLRKSRYNYLNRGEVTKQHRTFKGAVNHVVNNAVNGCGTVYYAGKAWNIFPGFDVEEALFYLDPPPSPEMGWNPPKYPYPMHKLLELR